MQFRNTYLYVQQAGDGNQSNHNLLHVCLVSLESPNYQFKPNFPTECNCKMITKNVQRASLLIRIFRAAYQQFCLLIQKDRCYRPPCNFLLICWINLVFPSHSLEASLMGLGNKHLACLLRIN